MDSLFFQVFFSFFLNFHKNIVYLTKFKIGVVEIRLLRIKELPILKQWLAEFRLSAPEAKPEI